MNPTFPNLAETERTRLLEIAAAQNGEPAYVYFLDRIRERYHALSNPFSTFEGKIFYAIKANANSDILKILLEEGCGAQAVSIGEVERALEVGFKPENILYTCAAVTREEIKKVYEYGVTINLDSLHQLEWFGEMNRGGKCHIRTNLDVGEGHHSHVVTGGALSKFGIHHTEIEKAKEIAKRYDLKIVGLHQHIGSFVSDENIYVGGMQTLLDFAKQFEDIEIVNFAGGFGVPYESHQREIDTEKLSERIKEVLDKFNQETGKKITPHFEPGRYLVADCSFLIATVVDMKEHSETLWVGINTGFNHLIRPVLYDSYHEIYNLSHPEAKEISVTVYGYVCESGDVFARGRALPLPKLGDIIAIANAGAYGYSMASEYLLRPLPREIVVK